MVIEKSLFDNLTNLNQKILINKFFVEHFFCQLQDVCLNCSEWRYPFSNTKLFCHPTIRTF